MCYRHLMSRDNKLVQSKVDEITSSASASVDNSVDESYSVSFTAAYFGLFIIVSTVQRRWRSRSSRNR